MNSRIEARPVGEGVGQEQRNKHKTKEPMSNEHVYQLATVNSVIRMLCTTLRPVGTGHEGNIPDQGYQ